MHENIKVYARTDDKNRLLDINSEVYLSEFDGWTEIDQGTEYPKYIHAQRNYLEKPLLTPEGLCRYKLENGCVAERTLQELEEDMAALPPPEPTAAELKLRIAQLEQVIDVLIGGDEQ